MFQSHEHCQASTTKNGKSQQGTIGTQASKSLVNKWQKRGL
jgi:hypothetical protein